jgi:type 1 fimbria pilin
MKKKHILLGFIGAFLFGTGMARADSTVSVSGTVTAIPCTITTDGSGITVDFGDILTTQIDGKTYKRTQVVTDIQCEDMAVGTQLKMTITGESAAFGSGYLATDKEGLGMKFTDSNSNEIPVNTGSLTIYYQSNDELYVIPTKDSSTELTGGAFLGTATLSIDYP